MNFFFQIIEFQHYLIIKLNSNFIAFEQKILNSETNIVEDEKSKEEHKKNDNINFISKNKKNKNGTQSSILNYFNSNKNDVSKTLETTQNKKDEHIINFNFENIKQERKSNKSRKDVKDIKSVYIKKNISKEKIKKNIINSISKEKNVGVNEKKRNDHLIQEKNKNIINKSKKNGEAKEINPNEKPSNDLSQMSTKNFKETLFDYKQYSLINNNPIKKKIEFEQELKKTKKLKDMSMKKKKKLWIKIDLMEKDKNDSLNEGKTYLSKPNQKSKIIELNSIDEEDDNKKENEEIDLGTESREKNDEDETDLSSNLIKYNQIYKKSQDDFNIELNHKNRSNNNEGDIFIGKYKQYLKNKNSKKNKDIKKIKKNYDFGNNFDFFNDNNIS